MVAYKTARKLTSSLKSKSVKHISDNLPIFELWQNKIDMDKPIYTLVKKYWI